MDNDFISEHTELKVLEELGHPGEYISWTFELCNKNCRIGSHWTVIDEII